MLGRALTLHAVDLNAIPGASQWVTTARWGPLSRTASLTRQLWGFLCYKKCSLSPPALPTALSLRPLLVLCLEVKQDLVPVLFKQEGRSRSKLSTTGCDASKLE